MHTSVLPRAIRVTGCALFLACLSMTFALHAQTTNAPATTKFFGSILVGYGVYSPTGRRVVYIGLHPTSAEIAKANACTLTRSVPEQYAQCQDPANSISCGAGGYFAVAEHFIQGRAMINGIAQFTSENAIGLACGKKTLELAQRAAIDSCEASRTKRGLRDAGAGDQSEYNCSIQASALNNGQYAGKVEDFGAWYEKKAANEFLTLKIECWGTESVNRYGPPRRGCP
jgi:hypothetical protein